MKLAVVGSRTFKDYEIFEKILNILQLTTGFDTIVSGGAEGADRMANFYANKFGLELIEHIPKWKEHGRGAGYIRNKFIWDDADYGIAFWDGESKGTAHSLEIAKNQNKILYVYNFKTGKATIGNNNEI